MAVKKLRVSLVAMLFSSWAAAAPFSDCPTETFLVQQTTAVTYGVELATGHYNLLEDDMGTTGKINAMGFNFHDNYLYAWSREHSTLAIIDSDFQVTPLAVTNMPGISFFVGDISLAENAWYGYRNNAGYGLYKVSLDPSDGDYLKFIKIIDSSAQNLNIFDMAFHPTDGSIYAVARDGAFWRIDPTTGITTFLGNVGVTGVFGAAYFDIDGRLYISRNKDGHIFRIDSTEWGGTAEFFAFGPSSGNNDGARCAMAPVVAEDSNIDFGDAPDSYGSNLDNNGARHQITNDILLGTIVDKEGDASVYPLSDDTTDDSDDDDGVQFVTALEVGFDSIIQVEAAASGGYLNAWVDWDQSGSFDASEKVADGLALDTGTHNLIVSVPPTAEYGETWTRFRLSDDPDLGPTGGVDNGEVEDYLVTLVEAQISTTYYPSANGWVTLAYEDNWPLEGDYDMNDLVVNYRVEENIQDGNIISIVLRGEVMAIGANYHNGFAIRLPGIAPSAIDENNIRYRINGSPMGTSPMEADRSEAIFVVTEDLLQYVSPPNNCKFYRTESACAAPVELNFRIVIPFSNPISAGSINAPFDPFLFATPGYYHGESFSEWPGRSMEVHLAGTPPTEAFDTDLFGLGDDRSDPASNRYFVTDNGMSWALLITDHWKHPLEYMDLIYAYPKFETFATSGGNENQDWFSPENANSNNIYSH